MFKRVIFNIATALVLCFGLITFVTYRNVDKKVQTMATEMNQYVAQKNIQLIENEFDKNFKQLSQLAAFINLNTAEEALSNKSYSHLFIDSLSVSSLWIVKQEDTILGHIDNEALRALQKSNNEKYLSPPQRHQGELSISFAIKHTNKENQVYYLGFNKNLKSIQQRLANLQDMGFAYLTLIAENGLIVVDPEANRIGTNVNTLKEFTHYKSGKIDDSNHTYLVESEFLKLPVRQFYLPINKNYMPNWQVAISIPSFNYMNTPHSIRETQLMIGLGSVLLMMLIIYISIRYWLQENRKREQVEKDKKELELKNQQQAYRNIENQLNNLKRQLNPHFLFNSLSSLYTLVGKDPNLARQFVMNLSKFYRKQMISQREHISTVKEELELVKHYIFLQEIRFGEALNVSIDVSPNYLKYKLPSLSLILLAENAMKHNLATKSLPLKLCIKGDGKHLTISNTYRPNPNVKDSTGTGLQNLQRRYELYKVQLPMAKITEQEYIATLPFINMSK